MKKSKSYTKTAVFGKKSFDDCLLAALKAMNNKG